MTPRYRVRVCTPPGITLKPVEAPDPRSAAAIALDRVGRRLYRGRYVGSDLQSLVRLAEQLDTPPSWVARGNVECRSSVGTVLHPGHPPGAASAYVEVVLW